MANNDPAHWPPGSLFTEEELPPAHSAPLVSASAAKPGVVPAKRNQALENQRADANKIARLAELAVQVEQQDALSAGEVGYLASWMVNASLPYMQPKGNPPAWFRRSGKFFFTLQPGYYQKEVQRLDSKGRTVTDMETVSYGYPYGALPRLILAWLSTDVAIRKQRTVNIGDSLVAFMDNLGIKNPTGGEKGNITHLKDMMQRMFMSSMHITTDPLAQGRWSTDAFGISDSASIEVCWNSQVPKQQMWCSEVVLTEKFFESLLRSPVPVDLRILRQLSHSPMAMDIYSWMTYRYSHVSRDVLVNWELLMQQLGTATKDKYKFREMFERNLRSVLALYSRARIETNHNGVVLKPSPTSVARLAPPKAVRPPSAERTTGEAATQTVGPEQISGREKFRAYAASLKRPVLAGHPQPPVSTPDPLLPPESCPVADA